jgi:hypothetical protein
VTPLILPKFTPFLMVEPLAEPQLFDFIGMWRRLEDFRAISASALHFPERQFTFVSLFERG